MFSDALITVTLFCVTTTTGTVIGEIRVKATEVLAGCQQQNGQKAQMSTAVYTLCRPGTKRSEVFSCSAKSFKLDTSKQSCIGQDCLTGSLAAVRVETFPARASDAQTCFGDEPGRSRGRVAWMAEAATRLPR